MLTRVLAPFALMLSGTVFVTGAWFGSVAPFADAAETPFVPQNIPLDDAIVGTGVDADQLLEKALAKLAESRNGWLRTKIRQTVNDAKRPFVAEGFLLRGPKQCVRLEMDTSGGRLVIVSDGESLAQVRTTPGSAPVVQLGSLPPTSVDNTGAREEVLSSKCCGGPGALLEQVRRHLRNGTLQTGVLGETAVIRVKGNVDAAANPAFAKAPGVIACVYLDAQTLWPHRIEWRRSDPAHLTMLRIDFADAVIGRELSPEECARAFSYEPAGNEKVQANPVQ